MASKDGAVENTGDTQITEQQQDVIKDNLDVMLEIVLRIREDEEFAKTIYADCPRLQHLLDKNPDLRPIFEDPKFVAINFEQVYRDAGGVLPGEEKPPTKTDMLKACIARVVNHPLFKIIKVLLMLKKVMGCIMGGGIGAIKGACGSVKHMLCGDSADVDADADADADADNQMSEQSRAAKEAMNKAAEHMENPEVQEQMNQLLEGDPDSLQEAIENDPELKALRDSNELCAELMKDPETMKVLTNPDNLRALGDCPNLIEQDFANPDWSPPDLETGGMDMDAGGMDMDTGGLEGDTGDIQMEMEGGDSFDADADDGGDGGDDGSDDGGDDDDDDGDEEEEEEDPHMLEEYELGEADDKGGADDRGGGGKKKQQQEKKKDEEGGGGGGGFFANVGAGITDMLAAELVGVGVGEIMGGDDDLGDLEGALDEAEGAEDLADQADAAADAADQAADNACDAADQAGNIADKLGTAASAMEAADAAGALLEDENMDYLQDAADEFEGAGEEVEGGDDDNRSRSVDMDGIDAGDDNKSSKKGDIAKGAAAGATAGLAFDAARAKKGKSRDVEMDVPDDEAEEEEEKEEKRGRFGFLRDFTAKVTDAAKEHFATTFLGDDIGEMFVEKLEGDEEEEEEDDKDKKDDDSNSKDDDSNSKDDDSNSKDDNSKDDDSKSIDSKDDLGEIDDKNKKSDSGAASREIDFGTGEEEEKKPRRGFFRRRK